MLNHIALMGLLVRDPELCRTQSSIPVTSFTIAYERGFKDTDGNKRCSAEIVANSVNFGDSCPRNQSSPAPSYTAVGARAGSEDLDADGGLPF